MQDQNKNHLKVVVSSLYCIQMYIVYYNYTHIHSIIYTDVHIVLCTDVHSIYTITDVHSILYTDVHSWSVT